MHGLHQEYSWEHDAENMTRPWIYSSSSDPEYEVPAQTWLSSIIFGWAWLYTLHPYTFVKVKNCASAWMNISKFMLLMYLNCTQKKACLKYAIITNNSDINIPWHAKMIPCTK